MDQSDDDEFVLDTYGPLTGESACPLIDLNRCTNLKLHHAHPSYIDYVPAWFAQCTSLRVLILMCVRIEHDGWLTVLPSTLRDVTISVGYLPARVAHLTRLKTLNAHNCAITTAPLEWGLLVKLRNIQMTGCGLCDVGLFTGLVNLEFLDLGANKIDVLPESISTLTALHTLLLPVNQISNLPSSFGTLTQLTYLNLRANKFDHVPSSVIGANLIKLDMSNNVLSVLPVVFCMTRLETLIFTNNGQLGRSVSERDLWHFPSLRILDMKSCLISKLPRLSPETSKLVTLMLSWNSLEDVPLQFLKLVSHDLKYIDLSCNMACMTWKYVPLSIVLKDTTFYGIYDQNNNMGRTYATHCVYQIMALTRFITESVTVVVGDAFMQIDTDALAYNINDHIVSLFCDECITRAIGSLV